MNPFHVKLSYHGINVVVTGFPDNENEIFDIIHVFAVVGNNTSVNISEAFDEDGIEEIGYIAFDTFTEMLEEI